MADHSSCKLGRVRPQRIDPKIPRFSAYLKSALPPAPPNTNWRNAVKEWGVLGNDEVGNCTIASKMHDIQLWSSNASEEVQFSTKDALVYYSKLCGWNPNDPSTDQGGIINDILKWWLKNDICGHKIDAIAVLDIGNRTNIRDAVWLCGVADIGVNLPLTAQVQDDWLVPPGGPTGDAAPGSWGGHDCTIVDYDQDWCYIATWGLIKRASWEWVLTYTEEAYAILSKEWLKTTGKSPSGFNFEELIADMKVLDPDQQTPLDRLRDETGDPILFDFHWKDVTLDVHQAAATYILGLIASAFATYGYMVDSNVSTFMGIAIGVLAGFHHLTTIGKSNINTAQLVDVFVELISVLQRKKLH